MNMKINKKKVLVTLLVLATILVIVTVLIIIKNQKVDNTKTDEEIIKSYGIDVKDSAYAGKKIYVQDGDVIIENENGSKTIESRKEENELVIADEETTKQYEISNVSVNIEGNKTTITGDVKNNSKKNHKIVIQSKFYDDAKKIKGTGNIQIDKIKRGETKPFEIVIMGNMSGYNNKITVEYTN